MNLESWTKRLVKDPELWVIDSIRDLLPFVAAEQVAMGTAVEDLKFYPIWVALLDRLPANVRRLIDDAHDDTKVDLQLRVMRLLNDVKRHLINRRGAAPLETGDYDDYVEGDQR